MRQPAWHWIEFVGEGVLSVEQQQQTCPGLVMQGSEPRAPTHRGQGLLDMLDIIVSRWKYLACFMLVGLLAAGGLVSLIPTRYQSTVRLMPPDQLDEIAGVLDPRWSMITDSEKAKSPSNSRFGSATEFLAADLLRDHTSGAVILGMLSGRTLQDDIINKFDLRRVYRKRQYTDAREVLSARTHIFQDYKSGIITIAVQDQDPRRAAEIAQAYVAELDALVSKLNTSEAHRERVFLQHRLEQMKGELSELFERLSDFSSRYRLVSPILQQRAEIDAALKLEARAIAAETELRGVRQVYGPDNPRVKEREAMVSDLRARLNHLLVEDPIVGNFHSLPRLYPSIEQLPLLQSRYFDLYRHATVKEEVYSFLSVEFELAKVQEARDLPSIKVLDSAVIPERANWPPRMLLVLMGTCFFVSLGFTSVMFGKWWVLLAPGSSYKLAIKHLRKCWSK
jgi:uncharacterized protein involved in exopolysaccharide biosynthesis